MKLTLNLVLCFILSSCVSYGVNKHAEVEVLARNYQSSPRSNLKIQVPSTAGFVVAGVDPSPMLFFSAERSLSELAAVELRKKLLESKDYEIYGDQRNVYSDYIIKVSCSEFIDDISEQSSNVGVPTLEAGILLGTLAGVAVPGLGALVQTFEPLTGIALSQENRKKEGLARFEFQIIDNKGTILKNFLIPVRFSIHVVEKGGLSASDYKVVVASTPQDAVRVAVEEADRNIKSFFN
jgi:hypothetical protein